MTVSLPLVHGGSVLIDDEDLAIVSGYKWRNVDGYAVAYVNGRPVMMHRVIMNADADTQIDHRNLDRSDNRRSNIRIATPSQNIANTPIRSDNTSGFKGVSYSKQRNRWQAYIKCQGHAKHLGYFDDPTLAARAYDHAALRLFGEFARPNFPEEGTNRDNS